MNTPERMEKWLRTNEHEAKAFDLALAIGAFERRRNPSSPLLAKIHDVVLMRHARLGRYCGGVTR